MSWICLIGASEKGAMTIREMGYDLGVITLPDRIPTTVLELASALIPLESFSTDQVSSALEQLTTLLGKPSAIVSFTELGLLPAAEISAKLGLPSNSIEVVNITRDKSRMRQRLNKVAKLALPYLIGTPEQIEEQYESFKNDICIVKPLHGFGSQQISRISSLEALKEWKNKVVAHDTWILEPFITGKEYSVETVTFNGKHHILGITEKQTSNSFVEIGHAFPAQISKETIEEIEEVVNLALSTLGVQLGATHTEVIVDVAKGPIIIETHTRPGGDCIPELVELSCGINQYKLAIESLFMDDHSRTIEPCYTKGAAITFFRPPSGYLLGINCERIVFNPNFVRVQLDFAVGTRIPDMHSSFSRAGYAICTGETTETAKRIADSVVNSYTFYVKESLKCQ